MNWTRERPTVPGWYWTSSRVASGGVHDPWLIHLHDNQLWSTGGMPCDIEDVAACNAWLNGPKEFEDDQIFAGPIMPPPLPEADPSG